MAYTTLKFTPTGGTETDIHAYDTKPDGFTGFELEKDGKTYYVCVTPASKDTSDATALAFTPAGGSEGKVQKAVKFTGTITQSTGQTITVTADGTAHTSTFNAEYQTPYSADVTAADGYTAGTLSVTGGVSDGTIVGDFAVSASAASESVPTGSAVFIHDTISSAFTWTCPAGVQVARVDISEPKASVYIGVTAGEAYTVTIYSSCYYDGNGEVLGYWLGLYSESATWFEHVDDFADGLAESWSALKGTVTLSWSPGINELTPTVTDY